MDLKLKWPQVFITPRSTGSLPPAQTLQGTQGTLGPYRSSQPGIRERCIGLQLAQPQYNQIQPRSVSLVEVQPRSVSPNQIQPRSVSLVEVQPNSTKIKLSPSRQQLSIESSRGTSPVSSRGRVESTEARLKKNQQLERQIEWSVPGKVTPRLQKAFTTGNIPMGHWEKDKHLQAAVSFGASSSACRSTEQNQRMSLNSVSSVGAKSGILSARSRPDGESCQSARSGNGMFGQKETAHSQDSKSVRVGESDAHIHYVVRQNQHLLREIDALKAKNAQLMVKNEDLEKDVSRLKETVRATRSSQNDAYFSILNRKSPASASPRKSSSPRLRPCSSSPSATLEPSPKTRAKTRIFAMNIAPSASMEPSPKARAKKRTFAMNLSLSANMEEPSPKARAKKRIFAMNLSPRGTTDPDTEKHERLLNRCLAAEADVEYWKTESLKLTSAIVDQENHADDETELALLKVERSVMKCSTERSRRFALEKSKQLQEKSLALEAAEQQLAASQNRLREMEHPRSEADDVKRYEVNSADKIIDYVIAEHKAQLSALDRDPSVESSKPSPSRASHDNSPKDTGRRDRDNSPKDTGRRDSRTSHDNSPKDIGRLDSRPSYDNLPKDIGRRDSHASHDNSPKDIGRRDSHTSYDNPPKDIGRRHSHTSYDNSPKDIGRRDSRASHDNSIKDTGRRPLSRTADTLSLRDLPKNPSLQATSFRGRVQPPADARSTQKFDPGRLSPPGGLGKLVAPRLMKFSLGGKMSAPAPHPQGHIHPPLRSLFTGKND